MLLVILQIVPQEAPETELKHPMVADFSDFSDPVSIIRDGFFPVPASVSAWRGDNFDTIKLGWPEVPDLPAQPAFLPGRHRKARSTSYTVVDQLVRITDHHQIRLQY